MQTHVLRIDAATYFTNLAVLLVVGALLWFVFKFLRDKARRSRHEAWERDGLLESEDPRLTDPDASADARAQALAREEAAEQARREAEDR